MKTTLFILSGEAFSGKSTLAKKLAELYSAKLIGRDEIYFQTRDLLNLEETPEEDDEKLWENLWPVAVQGAKNQLLKGRSVVFDDVCFSERERDELRAIAESAGAQFALIYLDVPMETLKKRKAENKKTKERHDVPSAYMEEDTKTFERPTGEENPVVYTPSMTFEDLAAKLEKIIK